MISRFLLILGILAMLLGGCLLTERYPMVMVPLAILMLVVGGTRGWKVASTAMGSARWANARELAPLMAGSRGLLLGKAMIRPNLDQAVNALFTMPLRHSSAACRQFFSALRSPKKLGEYIRIEPVHAVCFMPTGVGKSTGLIIPQLLTNDDSAVVIDFKSELAKATARYRERRFGHRCVFLDPFRVFTNRPDTLNVFDTIGRDSDLINDCQMLAESLIIRANEREPVWCDSAENLVRTISCYVAYAAPDHDRSLQTVRDIIADARPGDASGGKGQFQLAIDDLRSSDAFGGLFARMGNQLSHYRDRELASVLTTCNRFLSFLDSPAVQLSTEKSTFNPSSLKRGKMTVYCILPAYAARVQSPLLRLWLTSLTRSVIKESLHDR